ncbi:MAG TPA: VWA domain-containing protein, partial [Chloroflexia bacterium]|nr:VWA domain-containing protein [Chloroflexia bacterium]
PKDIPPAFQQELAAVQSVTLRNVDIQVRLSAGVELRRAYRVRPAIAAVVDARKQGRTVAVSMGDLDPANPPALLLELIVPTQPRGTFRIAGISVNHQTPAGSQVAATRDVVVRYSMSKEREEPNATVMNTVEKVTAYVLQTRALNDMAAGNISAATQRLRAAATRLLTVGETDLAQAVEAEAARLESSGQVSPEGAKEIRYATRKLTQRLEA